MQKMDLQNHAAFDAVADEYNNLELYSAEQQLLNLFRGQRLRMLDLGVGAGRTTYTFAPISEEYVGVDYSRAMVDRCKATFPTSEHVKFTEGDARDLRQLLANHFDIVLFSFNGIDYVEMDDRIKILREVRRVLKPNGVFLFSSHSLQAFPFVPLPRSSWKHPVRTLSRRWRRWVFCRRIAFENREQDVRQARQKGWAVLNDGVHNFSLKTVYVTPAFQCAQLNAEGFEVESVLDGKGRITAPTAVAEDCWLHYRCRKT